MDKTLIIRSIDNGYALVQRRLLSTRFGDTTETTLATFIGRGNLQNAMMFSAIEVVASLSIGIDVELDVTTDDANRLLKALGMYAEPSAIRAMIRIACEGRIAEAVKDMYAVRVIEG